MIGRIVAIFVLLATWGHVQVPSAQASVEPLFVTSTFFTALNAGDRAAAEAAFSPDAVATLFRGESYRGQGGIQDLVQLMEHAGRRYEIVEANAAGDIVMLKIDVSDRGVRWGQARVVVEVREGKLRSFHETAFHVRLGS